MLAFPLSRLVRAFCDHAIPAACWLFLAYLGYLSLIRQMQYTPDTTVIINKLSNVLFLLLTTTYVILRRPVISSRATLLEAAIALSGTLSLSLLNLQPATTPTAILVPLATALGIVGLLWSVVSLASLGRCFGILPEARGLVMRGPYTLVRHPLYLGEIILAFSIVVPILSPFSAFVWLCAVGLQLWRSVNEERVLLATFPEYAHYRTRTRRLIPFVW